MIGSESRNRVYYSMGDYMSKIIAVDFDGTLCEHRYPNIGKPNANIIYNILQEQANGAKIILWTCREGKYLDEAVEWCKQWGISFDAVNDNLSETKESFGGNPRKVCATEYWDDRAVLNRSINCDAASVIHARWVSCKNNAGYKCSLCKSRISNSEKFNGNHIFLP